MTYGATTGAIGTNALSIIKGILQEYGLTKLATWAWNEVTSGASTQQVVLDMYQTTAFKQRFPGIAIRQKAGLPPVSPATYISYETSLAQLESQYGVPKGFLTTPNTVAELIGNDVSTSEVTSRIQQGYAQVAYAPPEVRQFFAASFGASGDGALASYFLDDKKALPLLEQQAAAAQFGGLAGMGAVKMTTTDAMKLAQLGASASGVQSGIGKLEQTAPLYNASADEQPNLQIGTQGVEAEFGLSQQATQEVAKREQSREAEFAGGGGAYIDTYGAPGAGAARPQ